MRILVTGSRDWDNDAQVALQLRIACAKYDPRAITIVHGACPRGADAIADEYARRWRLAVERHHADWDRHGKRAGFVRNAEMVKAGADLCLAFIRDSSRGATHCADLAENAGIPTRRYTGW